MQISFYFFKNDDIGIFFDIFNIAVFQRMIPICRNISVVLRQIFDQRGGKGMIILPLFRGLVQTIGVR